MASENVVERIELRALQDVEIGGAGEERFGDQAGEANPKGPAVGDERRLLDSVAFRRPVVVREKNSGRPTRGETRTRGSDVDAPNSRTSPW